MKDMAEVKSMEMAATYICPVRGLAGLAPPDPDTLWRAASVGRDLGLQRIFLPILEESLMGERRQKLGFMDGVIAALDRLDDAHLPARLILPAQRIMGFDWVPPYLVRPDVGPGAREVFTAGKSRTLSPYDWWGDGSIVEKRIKVFRELLGAVAGHPGIGGWLIMDRFLDWLKPASDVADLVMKSYLAEIRERDELGDVCMGLSWQALLDQEGLVIRLAAQVDCIRIAGLERPPAWVKDPMGLSVELKVMAYLGGLCQWLLERPVLVELGWGLLASADDPEDIVEAGRYISGQGLAGVSWLNLADPRPMLRTDPPWALKPGVEQAGLLDWGQEPKDRTQGWIEQIFKEEAGRGTLEFIDVSREEYLEDPKIHLTRLWDYFRTS
jgi:hypothetical protein